jgi:hypothetical protein
MKTPYLAILAAMAALTVTSSILKSVATAQAVKPDYPLYFQLDKQSYDDHHVTGTLIKLNNPDTVTGGYEEHLVLECDRPLVREGAIDFFPARLASPNGYVLKVKTRKLGSADSAEATCKF